MKKLILSSVAALALAGSAATLPAVAAQDAPDGAGMRHMDMGYMLDAKIAGMKAALKLTTEQEKLWPAFETAVRDAAKLRREMMGDMREKMNGDARPSPIDMMTQMSEHMAKMSEGLKKVAEAAKPLYDSLTDEQKSHFGPLLRMLRGGGPHAGGMGGMGGPMMEHSQE